MVNNLPAIAGHRSSCRRQEFMQETCLGRSPEEGKGNRLQYFCLRNPMDTGAWQAAVQGVAKGQT